MFVFIWVDFWVVLFCELRVLFYWRLKKRGCSVKLITAFIFVTFNWWMFVQTSNAGICLDTHFTRLFPFLSVVDAFVVTVVKLVFISRSNFLVLLLYCSGNVRLTYSRDGHAVTKRVGGCNTLGCTRFILLCVLCLVFISYNLCWKCFSVVCFLDIPQAPIHSFSRISVI